MAGLGNRASFWTAAAVVTVALWASGAPSMVYPVYAADWQLSPGIITVIFAVYPLSLVFTLVLFGSVSDYVGRRPTLLVGTAVLAAGILLFAVAPDVVWLYAGRVLQGIGVGLTLSPASAAMVEFNPDGRTARASALNTLATGVGLVLATSVGGALVQYAVAPLHFSYWVLFTLALGVLVAVWFMPRVPADGRPSGRRWHPRGIAIPQGLRLVFAVSALSISAGFATGALLLSLGAEIAQDLIHTDNVFIAGSIISIPAAATVVIALMGRRIPPRTSVTLGGVSTALGMGLIVASTVTVSLPLFLAAWAIGGAGYGLLFLGGLGLTNAHAPSHHRAQMLSAVYLTSYLVQGITAVAIGASATATGLATAVQLWAPILGFVSLLAAVLALASGRLRRAAIAS